MTKTDCSTPGGGGSPTTPTQPPAEGEREKLWQLAEAATPGPWEMRGSFDVHCDGCGDVACACDVTSTDEYQTAWIQVCGLESFAKPNAAYIAAANPATILALLSALHSEQAAHRATKDMRDGAMATVERMQHERDAAIAERDATKQVLDITCQTVEEYATKLYAMTAARDEARAEAKNWERTSKEALDLAEREKDALSARCDALEGALRRIEAWEMPPTEDGKPYAWHRGSQGEQTVIRKIARAAVATPDPAPPAEPRAEEELPPISNEVLRIGYAVQEFLEQGDLCIIDDQEDFAALLGVIERASATPPAEGGKGGEDTQRLDWIARYVENIDFWLKPQRNVMSSKIIAVGHNFRACIDQMRAAIDAAMREEQS